MTVSAQPAAPTRDDLEAERDFLLQSIRDLDAERAGGDLEDSDYQRLREQYTARAAAVLRALSGAPDAGQTQTEHVPEPEATNTRRWRVLAGVVVVLAIAALAGIAVSSSAGERLPGEQLSGSATEGTNSKIARAQQLVRDGEALEAVKLYDEVLDEDPDHPVALAERGWLVSRAGLVDEGLAYVDKAIASEPRYVDARFFKAMILRDKGDLEASAEELRALLALDPPADVAALAEDILDQLESDAKQGGGSAPSEQQP